MRLLTAFLLLATIATAHEVDFVRVWPAWRAADSFVRIQEYFGEGEDTGSQTMLRTQPTDRSGFYFLTRTRNPGSARGDVRFVLEVITPESPQPKTYTFRTKLPTGSHVFNLGLTGKDWAGKKVQPVAWRLRLLAANDEELAARQSFLWSMPEAPREH
jgi:hypothetical protein